MALSVIICTYKPRATTLQRTLLGLVDQTFPQLEWELVIVANGDTEIRELDIPESLRSVTRIVAEPLLGLTHARLQGIRESRGDLLVFVDDDNVLDSNYLAEAAKLSGLHPHLGAFGGWATPLYEEEPSPPLKRRADATALRRDIDRPRWSNLYDINTSPVGAGMVVTRKVAMQYLEQTSQSAASQALGRSGSAQVFCEDTDLAWTAIDIGLGCGVFPSLHFTHLMPASRVTMTYLLSVEEGFACSWTVLHRLRGLPLPVSDFESRSSTLLSWWSYFRLSQTERAFTKARWRGQQRALEMPLP